MPNAGHGGQYITLYEAEKMMKTMLSDYEKDIVEPRHVETQSSLQGIKDLIQQGTGAVKLAGVLGSLASLLWIALQIKGAVGH